MQKEIVINSRKYNGQIQKSWRADLILEKETLWVFRGVFEDEVKHPHLGLIRRGTVSYEYYWKKEWFNVFRFHEAEGDLRNFYCNVNKPPKLSKGSLDYIDLDIDVLVWKDLSYQILDLEEFEENARKFQYPDNLKAKTDQSLKTILTMVRKKKFPFDLQ